jgi:Gene product 88
MTKTQAQRIIKLGNGKLTTKIGIWSITANMEVCGRECNGCYAIKFQKMRPNVLASRNGKLEFSKSDAFVQDTITAIRKLEVDVVRIHESGEFYSQEYIAKWEQIAQALPEVTFYTYSKRIAEFDFTGLQALQNFTLIDSLHHGMINYGKADYVAKLSAKGSFICPATTKQVKGCGFGADECSYCMTKTAEVTGVAFLQH